MKARAACGAGGGVKTWTYVATAHTTQTWVCCHASTLYNLPFRPPAPAPKPFKGTRIKRDFLSDWADNLRMAFYETQGDAPRHKHLKRKQRELVRRLRAFIKQAESDGLIKGVGL